GVNGVERVAREDGPASDRDPRRKVGIAARAGRDHFTGAYDVFLDVVDLDDLDARRRCERFAYAVETELQVRGADAGDVGDLARAAEQFDRLLTQDQTRLSVVDAVERKTVGFGRIRVPRHD